MTGFDTRNACDHVCQMRFTVQIRNMPDDLHRTMKAPAALEGKSLSKYPLSERARIAEPPTADEWRARLASREPVVTTLDIAEMIRGERDCR